MTLRVVLFGLDGATYTVLDDLVARGIMPNMGRFFERGARRILNSTRPPLTPPAWTTMVTGRTPGQHGVTNFLQFEAEDSKYFRVITSSDIKVPTLFTLVGQGGRTAGSLNFIAHNPAPKIDGYVVPGWVTWRWMKKYTHPQGFLEQMDQQIDGFNLKALGMEFKEERKAIAGAALEDSDAWIDLHLERERQWFGIMRHQMKHAPASLEAIVFDGVDKLQHLLWPYIDPNLEPEHPTEGYIRTRAKCWEYFKQIDDFLGETLDIVGDDAHVYVVSDHGFCGTDEVLYINTWLEQRGYLTWSPETEVQSEDSAELGRARPYHLTFFDLPNTKAFAVLASTNGISIQVRGQRGPDGIAPEDYERFRDDLKHKLLTDCKDPATGEQIITKVYKREEIFSGPNMNLAPDLTVELRDHGFISVLRGADYLKPRPFVMGTHHPDGVLAVCGPDVLAGERLDTMELVDVAPTMLANLRLPVPAEMQGRVCTEMFNESAAPTCTAAETTTYAGDAAQSLDPTEGYDEAEEQEILERLRSLGYLD